MFWNRSVVVYFSTATKRRSRGASWSIIAPPFIKPAGTVESPIEVEPGFEAIIGLAVGEPGWSEFVS
jgi:hypothetical protein